MAQELQVRWLPDPTSKDRGEVREETAYVYDVDENKAMETLRHEFFDYCVSQPIEFYRDVTNVLIQLINRKAYERKEKIIEELLRLLE